MQVDLSSESEQFLREQVAGGVFKSHADAVEEAVRLLKFRAEVCAKVQRGCEQLDRGEYQEFDERGLAEFFNGLFKANVAGLAAE